MKAVTWQGHRDIRVADVPDPTIKEPTDAIIRVTSSGLCGSDLHLYEVLTMFLAPGDILGREPMGIVEEVGQVPGGQAEYLRVPQAHFGPIKVPEGPPDDRFVLQGHQDPDGPGPCPSAGPEGSGSDT